MVVVVLSCLQHPGTYMCDIYIIFTVLSVIESRMLKWYIQTNLGVQFVIIWRLVSLVCLLGISSSFYLYLFALITFYL